MRRLFKYSWRLLIILLVLLVVTYFIVLHTQFGARLTINYFTNESDIKIKSIEGTLANELNLINVAYDDNNTIVKAKRVSYQIKDIHWFSKKLIIEAINIQQLELKFSESQAESPSSTAFEGLNLPVEIEIQSIKIDEVLLHSQQETEKFKQVKFSLHAKSKNIEVTELSIGHQYFLVNGSGSLQLKSHLPFELSTNWSAFDEGNLISGKGKINGDLSQLVLNQTLNFQKGIVHGELGVDALIDSIISFLENQ